MLILDSFIYLLCLLGIYQVYLKPSLPIDLNFSNSGIIISNTHIDPHKNLLGEKIISIDGHHFKSYEELIKICKNAVKKYVEAIVNGEFHLTTLEDRENKVCGYCSFRPVCRIQEVN